jgi:hypothetical protein
MVDKWERRKDTAQVIVESGATRVGHIMMIIAGTVRDVTREIGELATDVFEMREASRRAAEAEAEADARAQVETPAAPEQLERNV